MKPRQLVILAILLVVVGGAALLLTRRENAAWSSGMTDTKLLDFPLNEVSHVHIKGPGAELNLGKTEDLWVVRERADYPADFTKVSGLIRKLWELKPTQDVKIGASQLPRLQLTEPGPENSGTLIDLKGAGDKRLAALLLGKTYTRESEQMAGPAGGFAAGRYVMAQDGSNRAFLVSETFTDVQLKPEQWLNRDFIKVENPRLITLTSANPGVNWTLTRENATAQWRLADQKPGEEFDAAKATALGTLFTSPTFTDVLSPDAPPNETGLDQPSTARFETFDNFVYEVRIGKLNGESYPVLVSVRADLPKERTPAPDEKPEDKARLDQEFQTKQKQLTEKLEKEQKLPNRPYLMAKATIDQLLKDRSAFRPDPKPSPSPSPGAPGAASPAPASPAPAAKAPSPSPTPTGKKKK